MNCEILRTLFLKSNGEILCNDDYGYRASLATLDCETLDWHLPAIFQNDRYNHMRRSFAAGQAPWDGICQKCAFFRPHETYSDSLSARVLEKFQVEPSIACALACPACSCHEQRRSRPGPVHLPPAVFRHALEGLRQDGFSLGEIEHCGHGEPLMHPQFRELVAIGREIFPNARQRLITNENFDFTRKVGDTFLDEIFVSCDGVQQNSYSQYRINGKVNKALDFMTAAAHAARPTGATVIWKYIIFACNDSERELIEAQHIAQQLGVKTLLFVFSHTPERSTRYTLENAALIPILYPNVTVNAHPSYYRKIATYRASRFDRVVGHEGDLAHVDSVTTYRNHSVTVSGWALSKQPIAQIEVHLNGRLAGHAQYGLPRPDVRLAHPGYETTNCGFWFSGTLPESIGENLDIECEVYLLPRETASFAGKFTSEPAAAVA